jgi:hypothetical protein
MIYLPKSFAAQYFPRSLEARIMPLCGAKASAQAQSRYAASVSV